MFDHTVNVINTKKNLSHGFSVCELLLGFNPRFLRGDMSIDKRLRQESIKLNSKMINHVNQPSDRAILVRLASNGNLRGVATEIRLKKNEKAMKQSEEAFGDVDTFKKGDLVLLRRLQQDGQYPHKLEPRWMGPHLVPRVTCNNKSFILEDIHTGELVGRFGGPGRYHLNDVKMLFQRHGHNELDRNWREHFLQNKRIRLNIQRRQKKADEQMRQEEVSRREQALPFPEGPPAPVTEAESW